MWWCLEDCVIWVNGINGVTELADGYIYDFEPNSETLLRLNRLVDMERQCCQFLTFKIIGESGNGPLRLEVRGTAEAKPVIADFFGKDV